MPKAILINLHWQQCEVSDGFFIHMVYYAVPTRYPWNVCPLQLLILKEMERWTVDSSISNAIFIPLRWNHAFLCLGRISLVMVASLFFLYRKNICTRVVISTYQAAKKDFVSRSITLQDEITTHVVPYTLSSPASKLSCNPSCIRVTRASMRVSTWVLFVYSQYATQSMPFSITLL